MEIKCINLGYVVADEKAEHVEQIFKKHAKWMSGFYSSKNDGESHLISAYFTKSPEFTDPTDPSKGTTGNTIFTINERFTSIESIQRHVENASQNDYFPEFYEIIGNYGKVVGIGGEVLHSIR